MKVVLYIGILMGVPALVALCTHWHVQYQHYTIKREAAKREQKRRESEQEWYQQYQKKAAERWTPEEVAVYEQKQAERKQEKAAQKERKIAIQEALQQDPILQKLKQINQRYQAAKYDYKTCISITYNGYIWGHDKAQWYGIIDSGIRKRSKAWFQNLQNNINERDAAYTEYRRDAKQLRAQISEPWQYQKLIAFDELILPKPSAVCLHIHGRTQEKWCSYQTVMDRAELIKSRVAKWFSANEFMNKTVNIETTAGIYVIRNTTKNKYYVGQSKDIVGRVRTHLRGAGNGAVYADYINGHRISVSVVPFDNQIFEDLNEMERYYIAFYDAWTKGYNRNPGVITQKGA